MKAARTDWRSRLQGWGASAMAGAGKDPVSIRYWQVRPLSALWPLLGAMATLFAMLPLLGDIASLGGLPRGLIALEMSVVAAFVVALFWASIRRRFGALVVVVLAFLAAMGALDRLAEDAPAALAPAALEGRLQADALLIAAAIACSYALFIVFLMRESGVLARLRAEVELAALIHARLVSPVDTTVDGWRCHGRSVASSEMGGDLLDVVPGPQARPEGWTAYVVDVSGHGVGAGLFMGVVKTALRMALRQHEDLATALTAANAALHDQKRRDMFATLALVRGGADGQLTTCVAGHVPILHWSAASGAVHVVAQQQLPLGVRRSQDFALASLACAPGDLLALVSDGITEVFDQRASELGLDPVRRVLEMHGTQPLPEIHDRVMSLARSHGPIRDDETILLLRRER